jgi:serine O-acetyltransferase
MHSLNEFSLFDFIRADLRRQKSILKPLEKNDSSGFTLFIGILAPRFIPVLICRIAHFFYIHKLAPIAKVFSLLNFFFFGIEIAVRCHIGPGLFFPHTQGTVIGAWSIGSNATIFQGVTLGAREIDFSYEEHSRPVIGNNVTIGSGAKVLGGVEICDNARVGANSVVLKSVPANSLAVGAPARVV